MLEGQSAVTSYGRGVVLLKKELEAANTEGDKQLQATIRQQIAAAHASVAELYMTDLCFEDNAEVPLVLLRCVFSIADASWACVALLCRIAWVFISHLMTAGSMRSLHQSSDGC